MMKKLIIVLMIIFYPFFVCSSQENGNIFIDHRKFILRYTTKSDVEKLLGNPRRTQFYEHGGEDFPWKNFTVCSYDENKLSFHYDQNDAIIRITVNAEYSGEVRFLGKNIKSLIREDVENLLKTFENKNDHIGVYISTNFIGYDHILSLNSVITYSFWFDNTGKITWVDIYYAFPWE